MAKKDHNTTRTLSIEKLDQRANPANLTFTATGDYLNVSGTAEDDQILVQAGPQGQEDRMYVDPAGGKDNITVSGGKPTLLLRGDNDTVTINEGGGGVYITDNGPAAEGKRIVIRDYHAIPEHTDPRDQVLNELYTSERNQSVYYKPLIVDGYAGMPDYLPADATFAIANLPKDSSFKAADRIDFELPSWAKNPQVYEHDRGEIDRHQDGISVNGQPTKRIDVVFENDDGKLFTSSAEHVFSLNYAVGGLHGPTQISFEAPKEFNAQHVNVSVGDEIVIENGGERPIPGDHNHNRRADIDDILTQVYDWNHGGGPRDVTKESDVKFDTTRNGKVNVDDILDIIYRYNNQPQAQGEAPAQTAVTQEEHAAATDQLMATYANETTLKKRPQQTSIKPDDVAQRGDISLG